MTKKKIDITKIDIEDFIWMSYRYCIGRSTISTHMHATSIFNLIKQNPNIISEERKKFMGFDIRREIARHLTYLDNIFISISAPQYCDPLYVLLGGTNDNITKDNIYDVSEGGTLTITPNDHASTTSTPLINFANLAIWEALANWLDPLMEADIEYKNSHGKLVKETHPVTMWIDYKGNEDHTIDWDHFESRMMPVDKWNGGTNTSLIPDIITNLRHIPHDGN